jgi:hypothetical protein
MNLMIRGSLELSKQTNALPGSPSSSRSAWSDMLPMNSMYALTRESLRIDVTMSLDVMLYW